MKKSKISNQRLNKHKVECNELSSKINKINSIINRIKPNWPDMNNISDTYRDKIYEIYTNLEKEDIDFWSDSFELRDAIVLKLKEGLGLGVANTILIGSKLSSTLSIQDLDNFSKARRKRIGKQIRKTALKLNEANDYISNYDIKENINESLVFYFQNMPIELLKPNDLIDSYLKMKENIKQLNLEKEIINENEIIQIIKIKEEQLKNFDNKIKIQAEEIYKHLGVFSTSQEKIKEKQRAR